MGNLNKKVNEICVLIPAYNADKTIGNLIDEVKKYPVDIIIVEDGSTDRTYEIIKDKGIIILRHSRRKGKGDALKTGFRYAGKFKYRAVITLDADGQHDPDEIPEFISSFNLSGKMQIGSRMHQAGLIPLSRALAIKVANFFISYAAGQYIEDTQCGYRLYPLSFIRQIDLRTGGFTCETEFLIKAGAYGHRFQSIPVKVIYPDKNGYFSHFRPFRDIYQIAMYVTLYILYFEVKRCIDLIAYRLNIRKRPRSAHYGFALPLFSTFFFLSLFFVSLCLQPVLFFWQHLKRLYPGLFQRIMKRSKWQKKELLIIAYLQLPRLLFMGILGIIFPMRSLLEDFVNKYYRIFL
ncbi:MAG: glycosyltransferase family 2 protein [bacterium]